MNSSYFIRDSGSIFSPGLIFFKEIIEANIAEVIRIAGSAERLRPHVKTHKTREIVRLEIAAGIRKHKAATIAEAELLADAGALDVLISYPIVGPNVGRLALLIAKYPAVRFSVLADHPVGVAALGEAMSAAGRTLDVVLDLDVGQHRTGIPPGAAAADLYRLIAKTPGLRADGFHVYDGHNHQESLDERGQAVDELLAPVLAMREALEQSGVQVPRLVCGGTPTFTLWAAKNLPNLELSPGTFVLHDNGYGSKFKDLAGLKPAALLITRVVSRPSPTRVTLDLGYKAVASDPPAGKRLILLDVPEYTALLQNEEHLVIETPTPGTMLPGQVVFAIPTHICPTCAMHQRATVIERGEVIGSWAIAGRDRFLTV